jgi:hypothetical protein
MDLPCFRGTAQRFSANENQLARLFPAAWPGSTGDCRTAIAEPLSGEGGANCIRRRSAAPGRP